MFYQSSRSALAPTTHVHRLGSHIMMPIPKFLSSVPCATFAILLTLSGCSAPQSRNYQQHRRAVQREKQKNSVPPLKRAEYYVNNPEGSESDYHFKLGEAYLTRGRMKEAYSEFVNTVQLHPYHQGALIYLAYFVAQTDDEKGLKNIVRRIHQRDPNNAALHHILALRAIRSGDLEKAEKELKALTKHNPDSVMTHVGLSALHQHRGDYERAAAELEKALVKQPNHSNLLFDLGRCYWKANRRDKARKLFDRCLKLSPKSLVLHHSLAGLYRSAGDLDRALMLYFEALRLAPDQTPILVEIARTHLMKGDVNAVLTCLRKVKERSKDTVASEVRQLISSAYLKKGDIAQAEAELQEGLRRAPEDVGLGMKLADVYMAQQKYADAIAQYQNVLKIKPESLTVQIQLAAAYKSARDYAHAIDAYQRALRLQPDSPVALNNLAYLYAQMGRNLNEALEMAQKVDKRVPHRPEVLDTLGFVHYQRKEYDEALKYLKRAKELSSGRPTATRLYHLALVYDQKGMKPEAIAELTVALTCNPSPAQAQEIQQLLEEINR